MRDYRGLEELTDAVSRGLLVGDVIIALDLVLGGASLDEEAAEAIGAGESLLRDMAHPERAASLASSTGSLASTGAAVDATARAFGREPPEDLQLYLDGLADSLKALSSGQERPDDDLRQVIALFSFIGDMELARSNAVSRDRQDPVRWLGTTTPSASS